MSRLAKLKEHNPEALEDGFIVDLAESADAMHAIKAIADQPGGKELVRLLLVDVVNVVHKLRTNYATLSHPELMAYCATLNERINLAKLLINAEEKEKELNKAIEEALAE
jgi:HPt (histidine-containing phosphotransfer) domain-containing protein